MLAATLGVGCDGQSSARQRDEPRDVKPPRVRLVQPVAGATAAPLNAVVRVIFSESVEPTSITPESFTLEQAGNTLAATRSVDANSAVLTPDAPLEPATEYRVALTTAVADSAGNSLAGDFSWSFTTGTDADLTGPSVVLVRPADGVRGVAVETAVRLTFDEPLDPTTASAQSVRLGSESSQVQATLSYAADTQTVTLTPAAELDFNTTYSLSASTAITDAVGNPMASEFTSQFSTRTEVDTAPPTVVSTTPAAGAQAVREDTSLRVEWNEPLDASTVNATNVTLTNATEATIEGAVAYDSDSLSIRFEPTAPLELLQTYTLTVRAIADTSGNVLASPFTAEFSVRGERGELCTNGADDDSDGQTDCWDPVCEVSQVCAPPVISDFSASTSFAAPEQVVDLSFAAEGASEMVLKPDGTVFAATATGAAVTPFPAGAPERSVWYRLQGHAAGLEGPRATLDWTYTVDGAPESNTSITAIAARREGGWIVGGHTTSASRTRSFLAALGPQGGEQWYTPLDTNNGGAVVVTGVAQDASGTIYVSGHGSGALAWGEEAIELSSAPFLAALSPAGTPRWLEVLDAATHAHPGGRVAALPGGGAVLCGRVNAERPVVFNAGASDAIELAPQHKAVFVARFSETGRAAWARLAAEAPSTTGVPACDDIEITAAGAVYVAAGTDAGVAVYGPGAPNPKEGRVALVKLDAAGRYQWARVMDAESRSGATAVALTNKDSVWLAGDYAGEVTPEGGDSIVQSDGAGRNDTDIFLVGYDSAGGFIKATSLAGNTGEERVLALDAWPDARLALVGTTNSDLVLGARRRAIADRDVFIASFNQDLTPGFLYASGLAGGDAATAAAVSAQGDVAYGGAFVGSGRIQIGYRGEDVQTNANTGLLVSVTQANVSYLEIRPAGARTLTSVYTDSAEAFGGLIAPRAIDTRHDGSAWVGVYLSAPTLVGETMYDPADGTGLVLRVERDGSIRAVHQLAAEIHGIAAMPDGSYVVGGHFDATVDFDTSANGEAIRQAAGGLDAFMARYAADGALRWVTTATGSGDVLLNSLDRHRNGDLLISGAFANTAAFGQEANEQTVTTSGASDPFDAYLARYADDGTLQWVTRDGGAEQDQPGVAAFAPNGDAYWIFGFRGEVDTFSAVGFDRLLSRRAGATGARLWARHVASAESSDQTSGVSQLLPLPDGGVAAVGGFQAPSLVLNSGADDATELTRGGSADGFVAVWEGNGALRWVQQGKGTTSGVASMGAIARGREGSLLVGGAVQTESPDAPVVFGATQPNETAITTTQFADAFVAKYTLGDGQLQWLDVWQGSRNEGVDTWQRGPSGALWALGTYQADITVGSGAGALSEMETVGQLTDRNLFVVRYYDR